ncbi:MAG TPA: hypothetical protein VEQ17_05945 [Steroidobacteraceae bacterium]|nr:hypothetical protein [Steroidobacteraceae bacterium]
MKRCVLIVSAIAVAMFRGIALGQEAAVLRDPVVLAQDLQTLRAAGSFAAVLWTRRTTLCTLQVVLARPQGAGRVSTAQAPPEVKPQPLDIEVWLLRADGTKIPPTGRWQSRNFNEHAPLVSRGPAPEVLFGFPLSAAGEAVTAVMTVNGKTYVEPLQRFKDQVN